jgi:glycerate kinase
MPRRPQPPVLVAPDAFKGTFRAVEVATAVERGLESAGWRADRCPVADGGEGTLDVLLTALGGKTAGADVHDPLGRPIDGGFALIEDGGTAIVEVAEASGFARIADDERGPETIWTADTHGTGELIVAAVDAGAQVVLVAAGGSATVDGGAGAIAAIEDGGGLRGAQLVVLCDTRAAWEEAAAMYGPQKGADTATVKRLGRRLRDRAAALPRDPRGVAMSGAAGGLAGGLWAAFGAQLVAGAPFVLDTLLFDARMRTARAVVTGEGRLDAQSLTGKLVGEVATRSRQAGVPCHAIVGSTTLDPLGVRILDFESVEQAATLAEIEQAGLRVGEQLASGG